MKFEDTDYEIIKGIMEEISPKDSNIMTKDCKIKVSLMIDGDIFFSLKEGRTLDEYHQYINDVLRKNMESKEFEQR